MSSVLAEEASVFSPRRVRLRTLVRRSITIPTTLTLFVAALVAAVPVFLLSWLADRLFGGRSFLRSAAFLFAYLFCESAGIVTSFLLWLAHATGVHSREQSRAAHYRLQRWWAGSLFSAARWLFDFEIEVQGEDALRPGAMLLLLRHASVADTLIAATQVAAPHDIRLRYVLKRELLWDPCLDIVGNRLPNAFVRRDSDDPEREVQRIGHLVVGLGEREGVLIYPEGTRFTPAKRAHVIERLRAMGKNDLADRAEALSNVLPPRLGGVLALLDRNPGLDVVVCAHTGLERVTGLADLWNGQLVGTRVQIGFWRVRHSDLPVDAVGRVDWLYEEWSRVDQWVSQHAERAR